MKNSAKILFPLLLICIHAGNGISLSGEISGTVTNGISKIPFAKVRVQATSIFTTTNYDGEFTLKGISSSDSLVITAWAEGYYNGESRAKVGDSDVEIVLHPLFTEDNPEYQWISPDPDPSKEMQCGNCHVDVLMNQWRNNAHGQSAVNPFFLAMYNGTDINGTPNKGVGYKLDFEYTNGNCATCHIPGAAANDPWGIDPNTVTGVEKKGVFCDFCHKIRNVKLSSGQGTTGVLSIELLRPHENEQIFFGPFDDIHKPDAYLPLIRKSEFCAPCHTGKFWNTPAYNCFPEWQESLYPSMGIECQTCHMYPDSVTTYFAKPEVGGLQRDPVTIPSHLQPGSRDPKILANSVTMDVKAEQTEETITVMVTIYNDKTGHHVPTGRPSRNMILLVDAADQNSQPLEFIQGDTVPWWGGTGDKSDNNYAGLPGKGYAKILEDFDGIAPSPSWRPTHILSDNRLAAFASDTTYYYYKVSEETEFAKITARLIYRRFFKEWMEEKKFDIPDIVMEHETMDFRVSQITDVKFDDEHPELYWLGQNYPNPFNASTSIQFHLKNPHNAVLTIYTIKGQKIKTIIDDYYAAGSHSIRFDMDNVSSGVYIYDLKTDNFHAFKKLLYIR